LLVKLTWGEGTSPTSDDWDFGARHGCDCSRNKRT